MFQSRANRIQAGVQIAAMITEIPEPWAADAPGALSRFFHPDGPAFCRLRARPVSSERHCSLFPDRLASIGWFVDAPG